MANQFGEKLRLTAQALGCVTQKELCARFLAVNPQTQFGLSNSYKWISGHAHPRSSNVYDDWARVLALGKSGTYLANCPLEEFIQLLAEGYGISASYPPARASAASSFSLGRMLQGSFAVYSYAWSKAMRGSIIRGWLELGSGVENKLVAHYTESFPGVTLSYVGSAVAAHRALHFHLEDSESQSSLFLCCHTPIPPANGLLGLIAGSAFYDPESRPMAGRMLCIRHVLAAGMVSPNRYLDASAESIADDIQALGYELSEQINIGAICFDFLSTANFPGILQVPLADIETVSMQLDRALTPRTA